MAVVGFGEIAEQLRGSTVLIRGGRQGNGSRTLLSNGGLIVTHAHVVRASQVRIELWDGRDIGGIVESRNSRFGLAAILIDTGQSGGSSQAA
jgi:S1-C subfamily serine protease